MEITKFSNFFGLHDSNSREFVQVCQILILNLYQVINVICALVMFNHLHQNRTTISEVLKTLYTFRIQFQQLWYKCGNSVLNFRNITNWKNVIVSLYKKQYYFVFGKTSLT